MGYLLTHDPTLGVRVVHKVSPSELSDRNGTIGHRRVESDIRLGVVDDKGNPSAKGDESEEVPDTSCRPIEDGYAVVGLLDELEGPACSVEAELGDTPNGEEDCEA